MKKAGGGGGQVEGTQHGQACGGWDHEPGVCRLSEAQCVSRAIGRSSILPRRIDVRGFRRAGGQLPAISAGEVQGGGGADVPGSW